VVKTAGGLDSVRRALQRLDRLLHEAVINAQAVYGPAAAADRFRGLHIGDGEVEDLLARAPGEPRLCSNATEPDALWPGHELTAASPFGLLAITFGLSPFDLDVVLIALAPEIDLRYERLYAYLQDDVTRKRPTVDLALNLLCATVGEKIARRVHFAADSPLVRHHLVTLIRDPNQVDPPQLGHYFRLDEQIVRFLLGVRGLDARLAAVCERVELTLEPHEQYGPPPEVSAALSRLAVRAQRNHEPLRLYFHGPPGSGKRAAAAAVAHRLAVPLLVADRSSISVADGHHDELLRVLFREAWLDSAVLYLRGADALRVGEQAHESDGLSTRLATASGITILAGMRPCAETALPTDLITIPFHIPAPSARRLQWEASLSHTNGAIDDGSIDALADRFRLTAGQIRSAVASAHGEARWRAARSRRKSAVPHLTPGDLFAGARAQSGHDLAALAQKIEPHYTWTDIVLPDDSLAQLREICQWATHRQRVLGEWGFDRKLSSGKGVTALFAGPSGTGKTMAAEIIGNELGLELYRIDLSGIVSKYIGETEKNLERIFTAAENANAILFFDEADALFGKRSEVRDSHDRYANIEISYLLQRMERYDGITILATNLRQNLDDSFVRRLAFNVHFPFPDEVDRRRIWASVWPGSTPVAGDVDFSVFASRFKLSGGNIKNIALAAAYAAAAEGGVVGIEQLLHATQREYQKFGKVMSDSEMHRVADGAGE
jgi:ATP-dependent 26S proteasome regulatory subunit